MGKIVSHVCKGLIDEAHSPVRIYASQSDVRGAPHRLGDPR